MLFGDFLTQMISDSIQDFSLNHARSYTGLPIEVALQQRVFKPGYCIGPAIRQTFAENVRYFVMVRT